MPLYDHLFLNPDFALRREDVDLMPVRGEEDDILEVVGIVRRASYRMFQPCYSVFVSPMVEHE
jgi:hypothetical protein